MLKCYSDLNFLDQQIGFDVYIVGKCDRKIILQIAKNNNPTQVGLTEITLYNLRQAEMSVRYIPRKRGLQLVKL